MQKVTRHAANGMSEVNSYKESEAKENFRGKARRRNPWTQFHLPYSADSYLYPIDVRK